MTKAIGVVMVMVLAVGLALSCAPVERADVVVVKIHSQMPIGHHTTDSIELFIKEAEARSDGTLKFVHFPAKQLFKAIDMPDILPAGGVDMAQIDTPFFVSICREVDAYTHPFFMDTDWFIRWIYDKEGGGGFWYEAVRPALEKHNVYMVSSMAYDYSGFYCCITRDPVYKMEDYEGFKIRTSSKVFGATVEVWGGVKLR